MEVLLRLKKIHTNSNFMLHETSNKASFRINFGTRVGYAFMSWPRNSCSTSPCSPETLRSAETASTTPQPSLSRCFWNRRSGVAICAMPESRLQCARFINSKMSWFDWTMWRKLDCPCLENAKGPEMMDQLFASKRTLGCQYAYKRAHFELIVTVFTVVYGPYENWEYF